MGNIANSIYLVYAIITIMLIVIIVGKDMKDSDTEHVLEIIGILFWPIILIVQFLVAVEDIISILLIRIKQRM